MTWQHQQAKVEELQEEFAEDERFLKEQIQQKDLEISNLKYLQGMDKELIQTLRGRSSALQDKVNDLQKRVDKALQEVFKCRVAGLNRIYALDVIEQALKGEEISSIHKECDHSGLRVFVKDGFEKFRCVKCMEWISRKVDDQ
jgi:hypothetical protein